MEESIAIKHAEGNVFVDNFDHEVTLSVWTHSGHTRVHLTQEQAKAVAEALNIAINEAAKVEAA